MANDLEIPAALEHVLNQRNDDINFADDPVTENDSGIAEVTDTAGKH